MRTRSIRRAVTTAVVVSAVTGARRAVERRADRRFMHIDPAQDTFHELGAERFRLPASYHRTDGLLGYFRADLAAVRALLPSDALHPVRWDRDHAVLGVLASRHMEQTVRLADGSARPLEPSGEVAIFVAVTRREMPPMLPFVLERVGLQPFGAFIVQLPVTSRHARDTGRAVHGMPKFLADMTFDEDCCGRSVHVTEGGRTILDLEVETAGRIRVDRAASILYSVLDDRLVQTVCPSRLIVQGGLGTRSTLRLGDHPAVAELLDVGMEGPARAAAIVINQRFLLPAGTDIGPARGCVRYEGGEIARFATRHADGTVTDHATGLSSQATPEARHTPT